ncbi:MAG TPA: hypothetical protein VFR67_20660 [Pilimelia sp.]|nr:hypothetical protein [Pilimelia sp.]
MTTFPWRADGCGPQLIAVVRLPIGRVVVDNAADLGHRPGPPTADERMAHARIGIPRCLRRRF